MERDFMGLAPKKVKEEVTDGLYDSASARLSAMQWSFSNKVSALPQFLSFKGAQEDNRPVRTGYDSLASTGYMTISASEAVQKNLNLGKQGGGHYGVTNYTPLHFDSHSVHHPNDARLIPMCNPTNQMITAAMSTPIHHSIASSGGQNVITSNVNLPPLGGVPIIAPAAAGAVVGNTDLRNGSKTPGAPAQLTIFYDGLVCVFDDVSREKAQAIMLLAGIGPSATPKPALPLAQIQAQIPRPSAGNSFLPKPSHSTTPSLGLSRHIAVASHNGTQSAGRTNSTNNITLTKPIGTITSPCTILESSKVLRSQGPTTHGTLIQNAVPQARKASLARFLEKRKERVMATAPYVSPDCTTPASGNRSISVNSAGSSPLPAATKQWTATEG